MTEKKPYTPPTLTEHGKVVERTRGLNADFVEFQGLKASWEDD